MNNKLTALYPVTVPNAHFSLVVDAFHNGAGLAKFEVDAVNNVTVAYFRSQQQADAFKAQLDERMAPPTD